MSMQYQYKYDSCLERELSLSKIFDLFNSVLGTTNYVTGISGTFDGGIALYVTNNLMDVVEKIKKVMPFPLESRDISFCCPDAIHKFDTHKIKLSLGQISTIAANLKKTESDDQSKQVGEVLEKFVHGYMKQAAIEQRLKEIKAQIKENLSVILINHALGENLFEGMSTGNIPQIVLELKIKDGCKDKVLSLLTTKFGIKQGQGFIVSEEDTISEIYFSGRAGLTFMRQIIGSSNSNVSSVNKAAFSNSSTVILPPDSTSTKSGDTTTSISSSSSSIFSSPVTQSASSSSSSSSQPTVMLPPNYKMPGVVDISVEGTQIDHEKATSSSCSYTPLSLSSQTH